MKKRILSSLLIAFAFAITTLAQTTALVAYDGGYFVKNGENWTEYRPQDKAEPWNEYKQYNENDTFYFLDSKRCRVAIPKLACDKIFVDRKKNEDWQVVYNTISVHPLCPNEDGPFYCYTTTSIEYDGYFVRDNDKWREYRPNMKRGLWAEFDEVGEDENFFYLKSEHNTVQVPKTIDNRFIIRKNDNSSWRGGYTAAAIYDTSALSNYNYSLNYSKAFVAKKGNNYKQTKDSGSISLDTNGNIEVRFGNKHFNTIYSSIRLEKYDEELAICISIDKKNNIWILNNDQCIIDCKEIGKKTMLLGCSNAKAYKDLMNRLRIRPIVIRK